MKCCKNRIEKDTENYQNKNKKAQFWNAPEEDKQKLKEY